MGIFATYGYDSLLVAALDTFFRIAFRNAKAANWDYSGLPMPFIML